MEMDLHMAGADEIDPPSKGWICQHRQPRREGRGGDHQQCQIWAAWFALPRSLRDHIGIGYLKEVARQTGSHRKVVTAIKAMYRALTIAEWIDEPTQIAAPPARGTADAYLNTADTVEPVESVRDDQCHDSQVAEPAAASLSVVPSDPTVGTVPGTAASAPCEIGGVSEPAAVVESVERLAS